MSKQKAFGKRRKLELNLNTSEGTCINLIAVVKGLSEKIGLPKEREKEIIAEMISSDYDNLIQVVDREFGRYVLLYR